VTHTLNLDSTVLCRFGEQDRTFKGLQSPEEVDVAPSVGEGFGRRASVVVGDVAQWKQRRWQSVCEVSQAGAEGSGLGIQHSRISINKNVGRQGITS
jgi:hypothetical protein